ncbi:hypothetical protein TWF481_004128 [Arthrobotrys musiformis]|uniref:Restriction of telomere capping protein 4 n=1 Tax=Arthrobotrys musiformis TaxID=47236 RepID=A0AAV9WKP3_9PEZI
MYSGRTRNGGSNVNKPFKSPVIVKPVKEPVNTFRGLLDDIEDSDEDEEEEDNRSDGVIDLSESPVKGPPGRETKSDDMDISDTEPTNQTSPKEDDDEIEEVVEEKEEKVYRRVATPGKKGKFATRQQRETSLYLDMRRTEREAAVKTERKKATLRVPESAEALLKHIEKYDPVKLAEESPKPTPRKTATAMRERYNDVLKKNSVNLDPQIISLLDDKFGREEPTVSLLSDSDDSVSSASSRKRKRGTSDSETTPQKADTFKPAKQKKKNPDTGPKKYRCPMCNEEVSKQLYESYLPDLEKRYKIELRRKFHKSHKLAKVHKKVSELDIPEIEWDALEGRCAKYFPYLRDIMSRKTESHFRDLSEKFNKKKRKNNQTRTEALFDERGWEKTYPGYYGPRGSEIMGDAINNNRGMTEALKKLGAKKDITTLSGGAGSYMQWILVPELGTRLIMEDFGMSDDEIDRGRKLMQDTVDIGLLLNHGEDDGDDFAGVDDGMEWWWKEQEEKRQQEEEAEPSQSQSSIYIDGSENE